jgi:hypothetical protein
MICHTSACAFRPSDGTQPRLKKVVLGRRLNPLITANHARNDIVRSVPSTEAELPCADRVFSVFVTGNANKLKEVKAILASGEGGVEVTNQAVDGVSFWPGGP